MTTSHDTQCPYCGSLDVGDCGPIDGTLHHFECRACRCGFSKQTAPDRPAQAKRYSDMKVTP